MSPKLPRIMYEEDDDTAAPDSGMPGSSAPDSGIPSSHFECEDCAMRSPATRTGETLVSSKHGWRAARVPRGERIIVEWRCPACWATYRAKKLSSF